MLLLLIRKEIVHNVLSFRFIVTYALLFSLVLLAAVLPGEEAALAHGLEQPADRGHPERCEIVACSNSFHGRTLFTVTCTGQEKYHHGFEPLVDGFRYVEFDNVDAVAAAVDGTICAVLVEPIQGEGGVRIPGPDYLARLRRLCSERNLLLIYDEVQVGMGRTGVLFAHEHEGVAPDIMTLAKALGNGLPIGAMLTTNHVAEAFTGRPGKYVKLEDTVKSFKRIVAGEFDERDAAVKKMLSMAIDACRRQGKYVGICGQGPSDHLDFARWLVDQGRPWSAMIRWTPSS